MNSQQFSLELAEPLSTAGGTIEERSGFLLRCEHGGEVGIGEATPLPGWTESVDDCARTLEKAKVNADREGPQAALREIPRFETAARHGVSTALLDAAARADGRPLCEWFAEGKTADSIPVNATIGDADPETTAERARDAVANGFDCVKVKVGVRSVSADVDRIAAVRSAVGDAVELRIDANEHWSRDEARRAIDVLAEFDVALVEQPLARDDLTGHADLAGHADLRGGPVDVALDESLIENDPGEIVDAGAADALVLKPMVLGGPGEAFTLAQWARDRGLDVVVTTTIDAVVARTAAVHVAAAIPNVSTCGLATAELLAEDLGPDPAPVSDGKIEVPDGPGLGLAEVEVEEVDVEEVGVEEVDVDG